MNMIAPSFILAQTPLPTPVPNTLSISNIARRFDVLMTFTPSDYLRTVINISFGLAGVLSFVFLLWGGLQWILAGGEKEGTDKARRRVVSSLVGLAIVFSSYALLYIVRTLFNVNLIQVTFSPIGS